jgi:hypothetical protein
MSTTILKPTSTARIDAAFGTAKSGIRHAPLSALDGIDRNEIMVWCMANGVYQVPTTELVDALARLIAPFEDPIEICAGHGAIGRALGIPRTDSYLHTTTVMRQVYASMGQPVTEPPQDVEKLDAIAAINVYNPDVVLGCFVTQLGTPDIEQSSSFGVDEIRLLRHPVLRRYIMVGNVAVHGKRLALKHAHRELHKGAPWLVSRAFDQSLNLIYVWGDDPGSVTP